VSPSHKSLPNRTTNREASRLLTYFVWEPLLKAKAAVHDNATAQSMLPRGWLASPFSAGPSKGANLVVTFMDWLVALDPDGRPTNTFRHVGLTVPAQQNTKDETVAMVVTGLSAPPGYAPGPYGNFGAAKSRTMRTLRTDDGFSTTEESWKVEGEKEI